ncbi:hypothetical protein N7470_010175 [Penicillium chermesinum]|nr:hypothetical protein N7470_010175 [Penicillium chermesinum]
MQYKGSLLLAALAGSAIARPHGHERRHAHPKAAIEEVAAPAVTDVAAIEERAVGDVVYATIDNVLVSWINQWAGDASTTSSTSTPTPVVVSTATAAPTTTAKAAPTSASSGSGSGSGSGSSSSSGGDWTSYPSDGQFSEEGFGASNYVAQALGIEWKGNTGLPWGSNIIEVDAADANKYRNVIRFDGAESDGPRQPDDRFLLPNKALDFTIQPGETKYVAIADQSTGGWTAYKGDTAPLSSYGAYAATWGEFTMRAAPEFSSWDVSCIQAQKAGKEIQGMKICMHDGTSCSSITNGMGSVINAYTAAEEAVNGIGGNVRDEAIRLLVNLDYA